MNRVLLSDAKTSDKDPCPTYSIQHSTSNHVLGLDMTMNTRLLHYA